MKEQLLDGIYRICIPFENIYTTAFVLVDGENSLIFDCGTTDEDVEKYILPVIDELNVTPKIIVASHSHGDHFGGINKIKEAFKNIEVIKAKEEVLFDRFKLICLKGHSDDCIGIIDLKTNTLLSGDGLQLFGVGNYGTAVLNLDNYFDTIKKVRKLKPEIIVTSHDYYPLGFIARGDEVEKYLDKCVEAIEYIRNFSKKNQGKTKREIVDLYNQNKEVPRLHLGNVESWI